MFRPRDRASRRDHVARCRIVALLGGALGVAVLLAPHEVRAQSDADLAKQTQNPVADLISLPFQNNTTFGNGPHDRAQNVLNIQPVIPIGLGELNLINRTIVFDQRRRRARQVRTRPIGGRARDAGRVRRRRVDQQRVLARRRRRHALRQPDAAAAVPQLQHRHDRLVPGVGADLDGENWRAPNDQRWLVPVGGGFGKVFKITSQALNASVQGFYNAERPEGVGETTLRVQLQLLFPTG